MLDAGSVCIGANLVGVFSVLTKKDEREEKQSVVGTPSNKCPVRTMPETGQKENDKGVADDDEFLVTVGILNMGRNLRTGAAKRNIYIIAEPSGKRYMPASPELRYVTGEIGVVEVTHQFDTKEFSRSDCDVRIAGEIAVNLKSKEDGCKEQSGTVLGVVCCPYLIHICSTVIGNHNLFEQAPEDLAHSVHSLVIGEAPVRLELRQEVGSAFNGAGHQLREERNKSKESDDVLGGFYLLAINVYGIAEGLESIEGNADRKDDFEEQAICVNAEELSKLGDKEVIVFEDGKDGEVENDVSRHPSLCEFGLLFAVSRANKQAASPRAEGGKSDKQQKTPIPPAIEDVTGDDDKRVL